MGRQTHTIVLMDSRIGRPDGVGRKRSGAAGFMERVAPVNRQVVVPLWGPPLRHTIAMLDLQIGWLDGLFPRKRGVAKMLARVAPQQQEGVLELDLAGRLDYTWGAGVCAPSSGAQEKSSCMTGFGTG